VAYLIIPSLLLPLLPSFAELTTSSLPRYFLNAYQSGLKSTSLNLENPREARTNILGTDCMLISVTVTSASMTYTFENGTQIVTRGSLDCSLYHNPDDPDNLNLRLQKIHYRAGSSREYVARDVIRREEIWRSDLLKGGAGAGSGEGGGKEEGESTVGQTPQAQAPTPSMTPGTSSSSVGGSRRVTRQSKKEGGGGGGVNGQEDGTGVTLLGDSSDEVVGERFFLPDSAINDFGVTRGMMRCLEVRSCLLSFLSSICATFRLEF
jgi:hypothetical protein